MLAPGRSAARTMMLELSIANRVTPMARAIVGNGTSRTTAEAAPSCQSAMNPCRASPVRSQTRNASIAVKTPTAGRMPGAVRLSIDAVVVASHAAASYQRDRDPPQRETEARGGENHRRAPQRGDSDRPASVRGHPDPYEVAGPDQDEQKSSQHHAPPFRSSSSAAIRLAPPERRSDCDTADWVIPSSSASSPWERPSMVPKVSRLTRSVMAPTT